MSPTHKHGQIFNFSEALPQRSWHEARYIKESIAIIATEEEVRTEVISLPYTMGTNTLKGSASHALGIGMRRKYVNESN